MKSKKRAPISKTLRFEVFKRDGFECKYCGRHPPQVTLEADHIIAVASDGATMIDNLITACFDCNRGKGARPLTAIPKSLAASSEELAEREEQIAGYAAMLKAVAKRHRRDVTSIERVFQEHYAGFELSQSMRRSIERNFLPHLAVDELRYFMDRACGKTANHDSAIRYFCGCCWKTIKEAQRLPNV